MNRKLLKQPLAGWLWFLLLGLALGLMGFIPEPTVTQPTPTANEIRNIAIAEGSFVHHHMVEGFSCDTDEVMVGVHINRSKVICASLNYGHRVAKVDTDPAQGGNQVSSNPSMHGCPTDFFIQAMDVYFGSREDLVCVSLETRNGEPLTAGANTHDGRGPNNNGTQSTIYGLTSPTMHACPKGYAMRGIHQSQNDLYCSG